MKLNQKKNKITWDKKLTTTKTIFRLAQPFSRARTLRAIHSTKIQTGSTGKSVQVDQSFRNSSGWTEPILWVLDRNFSFQFEWIVRFMLHDYMVLLTCSSFADKASCVSQGRRSGTWPFESFSFFYLTRKCRLSYSVRQRSLKVVKSPSWLILLLRSTTSPWKSWSRLCRLCH